jgi:hypothetical protein
MGAGLVPFEQFTILSEFVTVFEQDDWKSNAKNASETVTRNCFLLSIFTQTDRSPPQSNRSARDDEPQFQTSFKYKITLSSLLFLLITDPIPEPLHRVLVIAPIFQDLGAQF